METNKVFGEINDDDSSPLYFFDTKTTEDGRVIINPLYSLDENTPNTPDRFVILKTTENGKYLQGNRLCYKMGPINIITESDNAIFVDKISNTAFIRNYDRALREINPEDPEERQYIILMYNPYEDNYLPEWVSLMGRTACYEYIKDNIAMFDPTTSIVLTENVAVKDALTVSQFVRHLKNADIIEDDGFNIEEYEEEFEDA